MLFWGLPTPSQEVRTGPLGLKPPGWSFFSSASACDSDSSPLARRSHQSEKRPSGFWSPAGGGGLRGAWVLWKEKAFFKRQRGLNFEKLTTYYWSGSKPRVFFWCFFDGFRLTVVVF